MILTQCCLTSGSLQIDEASKLLQKTCYKFLDEFLIQIDKLIPHEFIAKKQSQYLNQVKQDLKLNKFVVISDFSENYTFLVQDEVQGYHWSNDTSFCSLLQK